MNFEQLAGKIFGTKHEREVKRMRPLIAAINDMEPEMQALSDEELGRQTVRFREQLDQGASLDDLLIPAFATVACDHFRKRPRERWPTRSHFKQSGRKDFPYPRFC